MFFPQQNSVALRQRVHELMGLFELLPVGIAVARDRECLEMVANGVMCEMLGIPPGTNFSKSGAGADRLPFRVVENGKDIPPEKLPLQTAAREGIPVERLCEIIRADGTTIILHGQSVPLLDESGQPCGSVGLFIDVTERERLARDLALLGPEAGALVNLLAICAHCKKIRDDTGSWIRFERYLQDHADLKFTHGICPVCARDHWGHLGT